MPSCGNQTLLGIKGPRAAVSEGFYGTSLTPGSKACGTCYKLSPVGVTNNGVPRPSKPLIISVQDVCPDLNWCPVTLGSTNQYGYHAHFDLMSASFRGTSWEEFAIFKKDRPNMIVKYEKVPCPSSLVPDLRLYSKIPK